MARFPQGNSCLATLGLEERIPLGFEAGHSARSAAFPERRMGCEELQCLPEQACTDEEEH